MKGNIKEKMLLLCTGITAGVANGLFGGGGGMLVVPMLVTLLGRQQKRAHATALLVILPITVASGVVYALLGSVDVKVALCSGAGVVAGGAVGALLLKKLNGRLVRVIFACIILFAGIRMLFL